MTETKREAEDTGQHQHHVRRVFHRLVHEGVLSEAEAVQQVLGHLDERCSVCSREISAWFAGRSLKGLRDQVADFGAVRRGRIERAAAVRDTRARIQARHFISQCGYSRTDPATVISGQIGAFVRAAPERAAFVELLLEEARRALPGKPEVSHHWVRLAFYVLEFRALDVSGQDEKELWALAERRLISQRVRALAYRGNARRLREDFCGAETDIRRASGLIQKAGVTDLSVCAEVHALAASLYRAQRRFTLALSFIDSAWTLFRVSGKRLAALRAAVTAATIHRANESVEKALETVSQARREVAELGGTSGEPRLDLLLRHNEIDYLTDLGRFVEADESLQEALPLYQKFPEPWTQLRLLWVQGRIARGLGNVDVAEEALTAAREGFIRAQSSYDTALVSLELALLHVELGNSSVVRALACSTVEVFRRLGVRREALAAMRLFHLAALRDQVSERLTQRLLRYYSQAQFSPGHRLRDVR